MQEDLVNYMRLWQVWRDYAVRLSFSLIFLSPWKKKIKEEKLRDKIGHPKGKSIIGPLEVL